MPLFNNLPVVIVDEKTTTEEITKVPIIGKLELEVIEKNGYKILSEQSEKDLLKFLLANRKGTLSSDMCNAVSNQNYIFRASLADALQDTILRTKEIEWFKQTIEEEFGMTEEFEEQSSQLSIATSSI